MTQTLIFLTLSGFRIFGIYLFIYIYIVFLEVMISGLVFATLQQFRTIIFEKSIALVYADISHTSGIHILLIKGLL